MSLMEMNRTYNDEILYRDTIMQKIHNNVKITGDERIWLVTHSLYNQQFDFIAYNSIIESIEPNKWYSLKIQIDSIAYNERIIPIVSVPAAKGKIVTDFEVKDINGKTNPQKTVKMIGVEFGHNSTEAKIDYYSNLGLVAVAYECDYYDEKQHLHMRQSSGTGHTDFAIIREVVNENTIRYRCKSPSSTSFDALVFSISFIEQSI
ncbi:MAG: hypothetical protein IJ447_09795 [Clostridia bacterium]|nr:hypothetical protein [Clostridia bacterium]